MELLAPMMSPKDLPKTADAKAIELDRPNEPGKKAQATAKAGHHTTIDRRTVDGLEMKAATQISRSEVGERPAEKPLEAQERAATLRGAKIARLCLPAGAASLMTGLVVASTVSPPVGAILLLAGVVLAGIGVAAVRAR